MWLNYYGVKVYPWGEGWMTLQSKGRLPEPVPEILEKAARRVASKLHRRHSPTPGDAPTGGAP
jgi:hypothetical protein